MYSEVDERLFEISEEEWGDIYAQVIHYARGKVGRSSVKGGGALPLGETAEDVVQRAISRVFEGRRRWNPEQDPNLANYLMDVVDSLVSALWERAGYVRKVGTPSEELLSASSSDDPTFNDCLEALEKMCEEARAGDDDLDIVWMGQEDNLKAAEIAGILGMEVREVYQLLRKLRRRIRRAMEDHPCHDHWVSLGY